MLLVRRPDCYAEEKRWGKVICVCGKALRLRTHYLPSIMKWLLTIKFSHSTISVHTVNYLNLKTRFYTALENCREMLVIDFQSQTHLLLTKSTFHSEFFGGLFLFLTKTMFLLCGLICEYEILRTEGWSHARFSAPGTHNCTQGGN